MSTAAHKSPHISTIKHLQSPLPSRFFGLLLLKEVLNTLSTIANPPSPWLPAFTATTTTGLLGEAHPSFSFTIFSHGRVLANREHEKLSIPIFLYYNGIGIPWEMNKDQSLASLAWEFVSC